MQEFHSHGVNFAYSTSGKALALPFHEKKNEDEPPLIVFWAHGWGQDHKSFSPLISPLERHAHHIAVDFPGFGASSAPSDDWGTEHYADAIATWMKDNNIPPVLWVGHSFGCRVGLQIASRHPECIKGMCLISGAGLKRKRSLHKKVYFYCRIKLFKLLRRIVPEGALKDKIMTAFGSADYKNAGPMRKVFVRVVNEDLTEQATKVSCPVSLIYGKNDTETPPEFGERLSQLIPTSQLFLLDEQDHYTVLQNGRHQVVKILNDFIKEKTS